MAEYNIKDLIPHSGKMSLVDELLDYGDDWLLAAVNLTDQSMFVVDHYLDAFIVVEYMAQAVAALAGVRAKVSDQPIKIGMLLGTRKFTSNVSRIAVGTRLTIKVSEMFAEENGLGVFNCSVSADGVSISCHLNVYLVNDIGEFKIV